MARTLCLILVTCQASFRFGLNGARQDTGQLRLKTEKAGPSHKPSLFLTALGLCFMGGDVQPLYLCPHPTSDARVKGILLKNRNQSKSVLAATAFS
jgi:hypothetical protein